MQTCSGDNIPTALHYHLRVEENELFNSIIALHKFARGQVDKVTPIARLYGADQVMPKRTDRWLYLKLMARRAREAYNRIFMVQPKSIVGFCLLLPNGNLASIGFSEYPRCVKLGSGECVETGKNGVAEFEGHVETCRKDATDEQNILSHKIMVGLLDKASELNTLKEVFDPTNFWTSRNESSLLSFCHQEIIT